MSGDAAPTTVVLLTPPGRGAIASLLVSGPDAVACVSACFRPAAGGAAATLPVGRILFGRWETTGEELVVCRVDVQQIEIHCHGGSLAAAAVTAALRQHGCRDVSWPEWSRRSAADAIQAAALAALASATTERAAAILLDQYHGALRNALHEVATLLEGNAPSAPAALERLRGRSRLGLHLTAPWQVVLAGRPNVGKSSLLNALLGYQRAIVYDLPGTTRDVLSGHAALDGWPVELFDTAGMRNASDAIEASGVARARDRAATADLVVLVLDASQPLDGEDATLLSSWPQALVVWNKCDLLTEVRTGPAAAAGLGAAAGLPRAGHCVSALSGLGIEQLAQAIVRRLVSEIPPPGAAVPFTREQVAALDAGAAFIAHRDFSAAAAQLRRSAAPDKALDLDSNFTG